MHMIEKAGLGVIVLSQSGRQGIGLFNQDFSPITCRKKAVIQWRLISTLGFEEDERDYGVGASILHELVWARLD